MLTGENTDTQIKKDGLKKGLILGVILSALSILSFYFITAITKVAWLIIFGPFLFSILIPIGVTVVLCLGMRKNIGGYWTFKQAVTGIFIMFLICFIVQTITRDYIFAKLVEPDMIQKTETVMLNVKASALASGGADKKQVAAEVSDLRKQFDEQKNIGIGAIVQGIVFNIIMVFVLALIFGAIFKKEMLLVAGNVQDNNK